MRTSLVIALVLVIAGSIWLVRGSHDATSADMPSRMKVATAASVIPLGTVLEAVRREQPASTLARSAERNSTLSLAAGASLRGRIVDEDEKPVAEHEVWLANASSPTAGDLFVHGERIQARATTDAEGAFVFENVAAGEWRVGPAAVRRGRKEKRPIGELYAPVAARVVVPASGTAEIVVRTQRGLAIAGRVVDPAGSPVAKTNVSASDETRRILLTAQSEADGSFEIGPLLAGEYRLVALGAGTKFLSSDAVTAKAGDDEVVLALRAGGRIAGRVVDWALGTPVDAKVAVTEQGDGTRFTGMHWHSTRGAAFDFEGLEPGTYGVVARTEGGECGFLADIVVQAEKPASDLKVAVDLAATLHVRCEGEGLLGTVQILRGKVYVDAAAIPVGTTSVFHVPPGELTIRTTDPDGKPIETQTVDVFMGRTFDLVIRPYK